MTQRKRAERALQPGNGRNRWGVIRQPDRSNVIGVANYGFIQPDRSAIEDNERLSDWTTGLGNVLCPAASAQQPVEQEILWSAPDVLIQLIDVRVFVVRCWRDATAEHDTHNLGVVVELLNGKVDHRAEEIGLVRIV